MNARLTSYQNKVQSSVLLPNWQITTIA